MQEKSMNAPAISVIMSVKNGEATIKRSIDSILNQTLQDFEFIICDDGSTDDTLSIILSYQKRDNRIVAMQNKQSYGLAYSLNACIKEARSNILARQDADDWSDEHRFEMQYKFVKEHPEYAIVGTQWYNVSENGNLKKSDVMVCPSARDQISRGQFLHPTWMMRKDMLEKVGFYTVNKYTQRSQDYHLALKVLGAGMKMYNLSEPLYYYSADDATIARSINWKRVKGLMWIRYDGYRRNNMPIWAYIYVFKPVVANLTPRSIMVKHYKSVYSK